MNDSVNQGTQGRPDGPGAVSGRAQSFRPLRTWPALVLVALMVVARFGPRYLEGGMSSYWFIAVAGPMLCCLLLLIWWWTASRATLQERFWGFMGLILAIVATTFLVDPSMRGPGTTYFTLPTGMTAFVLAAVFVARRRPPVRTLIIVASAAAALGVSLLFRNEGMTGAYELGLRWRWAPTAESALLASRLAAPAANTNRVSAPGSERDSANPSWPSFRGVERAGRASTPPLSTNWSAQPPRQLWKTRVGPAWSSFVVAGNRLFTQEQRGPMEAVVCYDADTGREIWQQTTPGRFDEPLGGLGPRATPSLAGGSLFVTQPSGTFLRLDPVAGNVIWKKDLKEWTGKQIPVWGFAASPLVAGSNVIVYAGTPDNKKPLLAFDIVSGAARWSAEAGDHSYSSPQLNTIAGEELVLMLSNEGLVMVNPSTGQERFSYAWKAMGYRALQPHVLPDDTILLPTGMNSGTRAIRVAKTNDQFVATELWTSRQLKLDFTDLVTHQGYAYGADGGIFSCVDLKSGERRWKGGRYGQGQVILLESVGLLLMAAEDGRVVLLRADPTAHTELGSFQALEGKTWNHPVVVGNRLYVRNAQEAACFELPRAGHGPDATASFL